MAEGLGEVVLGIRVDQDQASAGLERFRQSAIKAAQDASQALNKVGGGGATITPKIDSSSIAISLRNIQGLVQALDNQRASIDINSPQLPALIRQLQEAKQRADALTSKSLNLEVGSLRQGLQSGQVTNNTANLERFVGLLREQQRLVPLGGQAFGQLGGEIQKYQRQLDGLRGSSGGVAGSIGGLQSALFGLGAAFGVVSAADIGRKIAEAGLNAESAAVRLRALTRAYGETSQAQTAAANAAKVLGISQTEAENGISQLYTSLRPTGIGLQDIETIFLSFNAAARNSGSTATEASNAFIQLKQALGKGSLNGDELRSIVEQAPLVAQAIAETLGVSVGKLRDLGAEGKITTDVILQSLERIKGTQLSQLGEQLDTGRQKLKDFQIAATEAGKNISTAFAPIGGGLLSSITGITKALSEVDLKKGLLFGAQEVVLRVVFGIGEGSIDTQIQQVKAQITRTQELIKQQTEFGIDTTEAEARLRILEQRKLALDDKGARNAEIGEIDSQIKNLETIRKETEKINGVSLINLDIGKFDFASTAQIEGLKKAKQLLSDIASGSGINSAFSAPVKTLADDLKQAEAELAKLSGQKLDIPVEATVEQAAIDKSIEEASAKAKSLKVKVAIQLQDEELAKEQGRLQKLITQNPGNTALPARLQEIIVARAKLVTTTKQEAIETKKVADTAKQYADSLSKAQADLGVAAINSDSFKKAAGEVADFTAKVNEADGIKAEAVAELLVRGIDAGQYTNSVANLQASLQLLNGTQASADVDSQSFVNATEKIAGLQIRLSEIDGQKALITAEFILRGLEEGTITNSINNVRTALDQLNNARATIDISSPELPRIVEQLVLAKQRVDELNGSNAQIEIQATIKGLQSGQLTPTLSLLEGTISNLQQVQKNAAIGSQEFINAGQQIEQLTAQQRAASDTLENGGNSAGQAITSAGDSIASSALQASDALKSAGESLRSALESGFKFLTKDRKDRLLSEAKLSIQAAVSSGDIDPNAAARAQKPEDILQLANISRSILAATEGLRKSSIPDAAPVPAPAPPQFSRVEGLPTGNSILSVLKGGFERGVQAQTQLFTTFKNGIATISQRPTGDPNSVFKPEFQNQFNESLRTASNNIIAFGSGLDSAATGFNEAFDKAAAQNANINIPAVDFTPVTASNETLTAQLAQAVESINTLVAKNWDVSVNVNTDNGAATVQTINGLN